VLPNLPFARFVITLILAVGTVTTAAARIVCCEVDGKRSCGDPAPAQCLSRAKTEFTKGGVAKEVEAPLTAEQRAAREAEVAHKKEEERKAAEQTRKDRALLDSFSGEKDFDSARDRAIADIEKNAEQAKNRLEAALKKKKGLDQEKEFYQKKPMPPSLQSQVKDNEAEITAQQKALQEKDTKVEETRVRYESDKARYLKLKAGSK
jgi:small-conductance mechanosensitive channel